MAKIILKKTPETLSDFKNVGVIYGTNRKLFSEFWEEVKLGNTTFPGGQYMEIVMAWMLGYFRAVTGLWLDITVNERQDKYQGIDFKFKTSDLDYYTESIDMKFDKDELHDTARSDDNRLVVRTYPTEKGKSGHTMVGMEALMEVLSVAFNRSTLDRNLDGRDDFKAMINSVWAQQSRGWVSKKKGGD